MKKGDLQAARMLLNQARKHFHSSGRISEKADGLRKMEASLWAAQDAKERQEMEAWEAKNLAARLQFEADFKAKNESMTKAERDELMAHRRALEQEAGEMARKKARSHSIRRDAWLFGEEAGGVGDGSGAANLGAGGRERELWFGQRSHSSPYDSAKARHGSEVAAWEQETGEDFVTDLIDTAALASSPLDQYGRAGSTEEEVRVLGLTLVDRGASEKFGHTAAPINQVTVALGNNVSVRTSRRVLKLLACSGCAFTCVFIVLATLHVI